jgi:hypothetical protein
MNQCNRQRPDEPSRRKQPRKDLQSLRYYKLRCRSSTNAVNPDHSGVLRPLSAKADLSTQSYFRILIVQASKLATERYPGISSASEISSP